MQAPHIICSLCQFNIPPNMLLRIICVNWPCTHIHINKCGYRILYAVIAYRMREPHTVCGRRIPYAGSRIPYAGSRIPYVNPPITQITNYMWLPHTGCGNRIQDAENRILYAVTPYLVDSHPICGARIQYAVPAYSMRDRIRYAVILEVYCDIFWRACPPLQCAVGVAEGQPGAWGPRTITNPAQ